MESIVRHTWADASIYMIPSATLHSLQRLHMYRHAHLCHSAMATANDGAHQLQKNKQYEKYLDVRCVDFDHVGANGQWQTASASCNNHSCKLRLQRALSAAIRL